MSRSKPLSSLLAGAPKSARVIAFRRNGELYLEDLRRDVAALLVRMHAVGVGRWILTSDDSYAAAVALLALAHGGGVAVLPPNRRPETLRALAEGAVGMLTDAGATGIDSETLAGTDVIDLLGHPLEATPDFQPLDRDAPLVEFQTSGTTGDGHSVGKSLRHLEDEVIALEARLGGSLPSRARIFATASHQHIYGLLFRVLWPLASGRAFQAETLLHHQELLPRLGAVESAVLVTTPIHLKRLAASERLRALRGRCAAVFSSGGPLDVKTAETVGDQLGAMPIEIFGSTETGGVATRQRDRDGEAWNPLPGVTVRRRETDGRLEVTSRFVSVGEDAGDGARRLVMGDRVDPAPGSGFLLLGRADRTVKIADKRLSLPEMERVLGAHEFVAEAALLVLELAGSARVHAVVVASEAGRAVCDAEGRGRFSAALGLHLGRHFDRVLVPRAWRVVRALPRDAQDKIPASALAELFADRAGRERPREPRIVSELRETDSFVRRLEIPEDLACLEGHFDAFPVVAGVAQIAWILDAATAWFGRRPGLRGVEALKFPMPLRPGDSLELRLELRAKGSQLRFRLSDGDRVFATGRALLAAPADEDGAA